MGFELSGFDEICEDFDMIKSLYPKEAKKFLQTEGTKLRARTLKKAKNYFNEKTGNYFKGIKRGKVYTYKENGALSIRVYGSSKHAHLLEYGHEMITHSGRKAGAVPGHMVFKTAADEFEEQYKKDCEKFVDDITKSLW